MRGRIGYAFGRTLIYATGGAAFGGVKDSLTVTANTAATTPTTCGTTVAWSSNTTETGYVVGGGFERYIYPGWSLKAEYQHIDLGSDKSPTTIAGVPVGAPHPGSVAQGYASATFNSDHAYDTVRIGLNYHILPDYQPLK